MKELLTRKRDRTLTLSVLGVTRYKPLWLCVSWIIFAKYILAQIFLSITQCLLL